MKCLKLDLRFLFATGLCGRCYLLWFLEIIQNAFIDLDINLLPFFALSFSYLILIEHGRCF